MFVIAESMTSAIGLERATDPLSPTTKILYALRSPFTIAFTYLTMLELTPPQSPLSDVTGTSNHFLGLTVGFFLFK